MNSERACTCPPMVDVMRGRVTESRNPCPVHPEPDLSGIELKPLVKGKIMGTPTRRPAASADSGKSATPPGAAPPSELPDGWPSTSPDLQAETTARADAGLPVPDGVRCPVNRGWCMAEPCKQFGSCEAGE